MNLVKKSDVKCRLTTNVSFRRFICGRLSIWTIDGAAIAFFVKATVSGFSSQMQLEIRQPFL